MTNILSLSAQRQLSQTSRAFNRALTRLASGSRINSARDDAAGLAIATGLEAQRRGMLQAVRNMNDARGFLDTADGALATQTDLIQRMRELAMQAANGTYSSKDRDFLNTEFQSLLEEFNRIATQTQFNGINLLDGSFTTRSLQVGTRKGQTIDVALGSTRPQDIFQAEGPTTYVGTGSFASATSFSTTNWALTIATADLNEDGHLDLVRSRSAAGDAAILFGNGDGTFSESTDVDFITGFGKIQIEDFNNDGNLDIVTPNGSTQFSIRLGNGDGTFGVQNTISSGATWTYGSDSADFNEDGILDLVIGGGVYLGNGNGTFQARINVALSTASPYELLAGDVNNDGHVDFAVGHNNGNLVDVILGNGDGTFKARMTVQTETGPEGVFLADLNNDNALDILVGQYDHPNGIITVILGNGDGTFQQRTTVDVGSNPQIAYAVDLTGDGNLDVLVPDEGSDQVSILIGNGDGTFQARTTISAGDRVNQIISGDFDEDGVPDIAYGHASVAGTQVRLQNSVIDLEASTYDLTDMDISTQSSAENVLSLMNAALTNLSAKRSSVGATQSRLDYAQSNALNLIENISAAKSQMMDTDYAQEMAEFTRLQVLQQAGVSVLSQANLNLKLVLKLLE